jgi:hypothetical protein
LRKRKQEDLEYRRAERAERAEREARDARARAAEIAKREYEAASGASWLAPARDVQCSQ